MLFDRVAELKVDDTEITGLDIAFEIEKDESPEPNPCHIEIFNLSNENRATLAKYAIVLVILKAGYKNNVGIIFRVTWCAVHMYWKTTLSCGDGASIQGKCTKQSYAKGTPLKKVIKDLAHQAGLSENNELDNLHALNKELSRPLSLCGNPMAEITRLLSDQ